MQICVKVINFKFTKRNTKHTIFAKLKFAMAREKVYKLLRIYLDASNIQRCVKINFIIWA